MGGEHRAASLARRASECGGCLELNRDCPSPPPILPPSCPCHSVWMPSFPFSLRPRPSGTAARVQACWKEPGRRVVSGSRRGTLPSSRSAAQSLALPGQRRPPSRPAPTRRPRDTRTTTTAGEGPALGIHWAREPFECAAERDPRKEGGRSGGSSDTGAKIWGSPSAEDALVCLS